jgi:DNA-binding IclR family transcriptional regulator
MLPRVPVPRVQSVERSLEILEALAADQQLALGAIAERTGLRPSTAHRLLATLVARGYAVQVRPSGQYMLGYRLAELAGVVDQRSERLRAVARPHLAEIQQATGESANLSVLVAPNAVYLDQVDGTRAVRMSARIGGAVPAHASAAGKAMLAFSTAGSLRELVGGEPLPRLTAATITTLAKLEEQLATVRARGYAIDDEEHEPGVGCVAAPVLNAATAVAALSVSAPVQRIRTGDPAALGALLAAQAAAVSRGLAGVPRHISQVRV